MSRIHVKVRASAIGGALCAVLTAVLQVVDISGTPWLVSASTALAAALAGYATPAAGHAVSQDNGE